VQYQLLVTIFHTSQVDKYHSVQKERTNNLRYIKDYFTEAIPNWQFTKSRICCLLLLGYAGFLRFNDLAQIRASNLKFSSSHHEILIKQYSNSCNRSRQCTQIVICTPRFKFVESEQIFFNWICTFTRFCNNWLFFS
jgi:hypothetical protein